MLEIIDSMYVYPRLIKNIFMGNSIYILSGVFLDGGNNSNQQVVESL